MKKNYLTEQKKYLISFLRSNSTRQYTIEEIAEEMGDVDQAPGKSTLYRLMSNLVEDGFVRRFAKDNSRQFVYQLLDGEHCNAHFHLKCMSCGRLVHLDQPASDDLQRSIFSQHHFIIDEGKTMLYGKCIGCSALKENQEADS